MTSVDKPNSVSFETPQVAEIEIFLDSRLALHVRVNGMSLAPIAPPDHSAETAEKYLLIAREVKDELDRLIHDHHGEISKLPSYMENVRRIGSLLGGVLFGYRDALESDQGRHWHNDLDRALDHLYRKAEKARGFIAISFAAESRMWNALPWEVAIWRRGAREIHLGVAEHLTFARRVHHPGYSEGLSEKPDSTTKMSLLHVSSLATPDSATSDRANEQIHGQLAGHLEYLQGKHPRQLARADVIYTAHWRSLTSTATDIFQFFGHGNKKRRIIWTVEEGRQDAGLQIGARELIEVMQEQDLPRLFVIVACNSFGFVEDLLRQGAARRVVAGVGMLGRMASETATQRAIRSGLLLPALSIWPPGSGVAAHPPIYVPDRNRQFVEPGRSDSRKLVSTGVTAPRRTGSQPLRRGLLGAADSYRPVEGRRR